MDTNLFITIGALFAANTVMSKWDKWKLKRDMLKEMNLRDDKKKGKYIYVVGIEDFEYDRELLTDVLEKIGNPHSVYSVERDLITNLPTEPCVYVIDDRLQQLDGREIWKAIKKKNPENYGILNTGMQNDVILSEYIKLRINAFEYKGNIDHKSNLEAAVRAGIRELANR